MAVARSCAYSQPCGVQGAARAAPGGLPSVTQPPPPAQPAAAQPAGAQPPPVQPAEHVAPEAARPQRAISDRALAAAEAEAVWNVQHVLSLIAAAPRPQQQAQLQMLHHRMQATRERVAAMLEAAAHHPPPGLARAPTGAQKRGSEHMEAPEPLPPMPTSPPVATGAAAEQTAQLAAAPVAALPAASPELSPADSGQLSQGATLLGHCQPYPCLRPHACAASGTSELVAAVARVRRSIEQSASALRQPAEVQGHSREVTATGSVPYQQGPSATQHHPGAGEACAAARLLMQQLQCEQDEARWPQQLLEPAQAQMLQRICAAEMQQLAPQQNERQSHAAPQEAQLLRWLDVLQRAQLQHHPLVQSLHAQMQQQQQLSGLGHELGNVSLPKPPLCGENVAQQAPSWQCGR